MTWHILNRCGHLHFISLGNIVSKYSWKKIRKITYHECLFDITSLYLRHIWSFLLRYFGFYSVVKTTEKTVFFLTFCSYYPIFSGNSQKGISSNWFDHEAMFDVSTKKYFLSGKITFGSDYDCRKKIFPKNVRFVFKS